MRTLLRSVGMVLLVVAGAACRDDLPTETPTSGEVRFSIVSGDGQRAPAGTELPQPVVVRLEDGRGRPLAGRLVNFVVTKGGGDVFAGAAITNEDGLAKDWWTLGPQSGENALEVRAVNSTTGQRIVYGRFRATGTAESGAVTAPQRAIGEFGRLTVRQNGNEWHTVRLSRSFQKPVVVLGPLSQEGSSPVVLRVRNVQSDRFQFRVERWLRDGRPHPTETVSYLVVEAGSHHLPDGTPIQAGIANRVTERWTSVRLSGFGAAPVVLSQLGSENGATPVITRHGSVTASRFTLRLQEAEQEDGTHRPEAVHWVAIGRTRIPGLLRVGTTGKAVNHRWTRIRFNEKLERPAFLAAIQSYVGNDPATLRQRALTADGVDVRIAEETSRDQETQHKEEAVGFVVLSGSAGSVLRGR